MQIYIPFSVRHFIPLPIGNYYLTIMQVVIIRSIWPRNRCGVTLFKLQFGMQNLRNMLCCVKIPIMILPKKVLEKICVSPIYVPFIWIYYVAIFWLLIKSMKLFRLKFFPPQWNLKGCHVIFLYISHYREMACNTLRMRRYEIILSVAFFI